MMEKRLWCVRRECLESFRGIPDISYEIVYFRADEIANKPLCSAGIPHEDKQRALASISSRCTYKSPRRLRVAPARHMNLKVNCISQRYTRIILEVKHSEQKFFYIVLARKKNDNINY